MTKRSADWLILGAFAAVAIGLACLSQVPRKPNQYLSDHPGHYADAAMNAAAAVAATAAIAGAVNASVADLRVGAQTLRASARNPDRFRLLFAAHGSGGTRCYQYGAENGFGELDVEDAVVTRRGQGLVEDSVAWNAHCANRSVSNFAWRINGGIAPR
jgi:F0F1-type ATP synthase membrane subunit c/vacuolar-type H+-ATPase subunit K